jgi:hypothetical protein
MAQQNSVNMFFPKCQIPFHQRDAVVRESRGVMRNFWERLGILLPVYRLVGRGLSDSEIANELNLTEGKVETCISWMLRFLKLTNRLELVRHACSAAQKMSGTYHLDLAICGPKSDPRPAAAAFPTGACVTLGNPDYSTARRYLP